MSCVRELFLCRGTSVRWHHLLSLSNRERLPSSLLWSFLSPYLKTNANRLLLGFLDLEETLDRRVIWQGAFCLRDIVRAVCIFLTAQ